MQVFHGLQTFSIYSTVKLPGAVVVAADKYATIMDLGSAVFHRTYKQEMKQSIL